LVLPVVGGLDSLSAQPDRPGTTQGVPGKKR
jgi:hypothetical protein